MEKSLARLGKRLSFPEAPPGTAAYAYLIKPSKPLRAVGLRLPESIEWLKVRVVPQADGGVWLELDAKDESEELAREHADTLETLLRRASEIDLSRMGAVGALAAFALGGTKQKVVQSIELEGRGDHIEGTVKVTARQLENLADLLDAVLPPPSAASSAPAPREVRPDTEPEAGSGGVTGQSPPSEAPPSEAPPSDVSPAPLEPVVPSEPAPEPLADSP